MTRRKAVEAAAVAELDEDAGLLGELADDEPAPVPFWEWRPGKGPYPEVFADQKPGQRCKWTCLWVDSRCRPLSPEAQGYVLEHMAPEQIYFELRDVAERQGPYQLEAARLFGEWNAKGQDEAIGRARVLLQKARPHYVEALAPWDMASGPLIRRRQYRRGWRPEGVGGAWLEVG